MPRLELECNGYRVLDTLEGELAAPATTAAKQTIENAAGTMAKPKRGWAHAWGGLTASGFELGEDIARFVPHITAFPLLAAGLLLAALCPGIPETYFRILRWVVCSVSCLGMVITKKQRSDNWWFTAMLVVAALFNPIYPLKIDRANWPMLDLAGGIFFLFSIAAFKKPPDKAEGGE